MWYRFITILAIFLLLNTGMVFGAEFRSYRPIQTPSEKGIQVQKEKLFDRERKAIEKAIGDSAANMPELINQEIHKIFAAWNSGDIANYLSDHFYDITRFLDSMNVKVPRDAKLIVLSIGSVQVLNQSLQEISEDKTQFTCLSEVLATVESQIQYNDPAEGFKRLEGKNEFLLDVVQVFKRKGRN